MSIIQVLACCERWDRASIYCGGKSAVQVGGGRVLGLVCMVKSELFQIIVLPLSLLSFFFPFFPLSAAASGNLAKN